MTAADGGSAAKTHISLTVKDLEASVAFYEAFFGAPAHKRRPGYANFDLAAPPLKLALQQGEAGPAGSLNHLGIMVAEREQVREARDRLREAGLAVFDEGETHCCHALQDKLWVTDPDGHRWEVYALLDDLREEDAAPAEPAPAAAAEPACCSAPPACRG